MFSRSPVGQQRSDDWSVMVSGIPPENEAYSNITGVYLDKDITYVFALVTNEGSFVNTPEPGSPVLELPARNQGEAKQYGRTFFLII